MIKKLRIIHLDDDLFSTSLIQTLLAEEGFVCDIDCAESVGNFNALLERGEFDLVLAELALPGISGMTALTMTRERYPDLPFIFVTNTMGEELAIESLKSGASDCVMKSRLSRLAPAVLRALKENEECGKRRSAEEAQLKSGYFSRNATELINLENQLRHTRKMDAVGLLTGGIAHDFNNFLSVIMGHASLLAKKLPNDGELADHLRQIFIAADRVSQLTQSLLDFSRKQTSELRELKLNELITRVDRMIASAVREDVKRIVNLSHEALTVMGDEGQLEQVLINLITNAMDAMPHGGVITIGTAIEEIDREFAGIHGFGEPGRYAMLTVTDNGIGMDEGTRQKIFEPFFTTKEAGKGTGLGLSIAYGIVKRHMGFINCRSEPGRGTTFGIYLPLKEADSDYPAGDDEAARRNI